jgi:putative endonuclease
MEIRLTQHQNGVGAKHTPKRLPVNFIHIEEFTSISEAFYKEKQIQGWSRKKKLTLIHNKMEGLHKFSECKNETHFKNKKASTPLSRRKENNTE